MAPVTFPSFKLVKLYQIALGLKGRGKKWGQKTATFLKTKMGNRNKRWVLSEHINKNAIFSNIEEKSPTSLKLAFKKSGLSVRDRPFSEKGRPKKRK